MLNIAHSGDNSSDGAYTVQGQPVQDYTRFVHAGHHRKTRSQLVDIGTNERGSPGKVHVVPNRDHHRLTHGGDGFSRADVTYHSGRHSVVLRKSFGGHAEQRLPDAVDFSRSEQPAEDSLSYTLKT